MIKPVSFKGLPKNTKYVSDKIVVGARQGLKNLRKLKNEENVTLVVDVRKKHFFHKFFNKIYSKILGVKIIEQPTTLGKKTINFDNFEKISDVILKNDKGKTFVHCSHGKHRSVIVSAITQIKTGKIKTKDDFTEFLTRYNFFKTGKKLISKMFRKTKKEKVLKHLKEVRDKFSNRFNLK